MQTIIFGLIGITLGLVLCLTSEWLLRIFGRVEWAERNMRELGGTRMFYKLLGILVILVSVFYMTGGVESFLKKIFFLGE